MYQNVLDPGKSVSFVLKDIDISVQNQYAMCTGPLRRSAADISARKVSVLLLSIVLGLTLIISICNSKTR